MKAAIDLLSRKINSFTFDKSLDQKTHNELIQARAVLQAAEKIDKQKSIDALDGCFLSLAYHGWNTLDPDIVAVMNLLKTLPAGEVKK